MFIFISTAIIVKGYTRDCIYDLHRYKFFYIPKTLTKILETYSGNATWETLENDFTDEKQIIAQYYDFLTENDLIFFTNDTEYFKDLDLSWYNSSQILNVIIEANEDLIPTNLINQLDELNCKSYEVRIHKSFLFKDIIEFVKLLGTSKAREVSLVFFNNSLTESQLKSLVDLCTKILKISIFKSEANKKNEFDIGATKAPIIYHSISIKEFENKYFYTYGIVNLNFFSESQTYNTYLNRKIFINHLGDVYNSPQSKQIYGNIKEQSLSSILDESTINSLWKIGKNKIDICKDCELRHMCLNTSELSYDKELDLGKYIHKCEYNPYIAKWKGEKGWEDVQSWRNQQLKN